MNNRVRVSDSTWTADADPPREVAEVLDRYLADLERGAPNPEAILAAHPQLADELRPYFESLHLLHGATREFQALRMLAGESPAPNGQASEPAARQIGDYRIVREVGRGGMGIVYEAHQISLNRRVALKMLPFAAVLDPRQIARFRNEAQAAAQLHHPHIVPVFAVGQEQGVYYYAMQYIEGQSLEQVISELRQDAEELRNRSTKIAGGVRGSTATVAVDGAAARLSRPSIPHGGDFFNAAAALGKQAAEALQHAHELGIVHRDIKPSNLLLDGHGKLWVTDFGLARIQTDNGVTLTGDVIGTLRYMSPEQASGQSALVDARSDVYSLGVTLYELLTQRPPFPGENRQSLLRQIVGDEPTPPRRHVPSLPLDLETIVLSAMAKSRDERYPTAQAMADDLERFLAGRPTLARRPTLVDRAAKWARRHRSVVAVAAAAVVLLCMLSVTGLVLLAREQARTASARDEAEENARKATENFREARDTVDRLGVRIADRLAQLPGAEAVRRDLLIDTLGYYQKFAQEAGDEPQLRQELALAHFKSAALATQLGAGPNAIGEYEEAIRLLGELVADDPTNAEALSQLAVAHNNLALLHAGRGEVDAARQHYDRAIRTGERLLEQNGDDPALASHLAETQANFGMLLHQVGDSQEAEHLLRAAMGVLRGLMERHADVAKHDRDLAIACNNLSYLLRTSDRSESERLVCEAIAHLDRLRQLHPNLTTYQEDLALCYNNLASLHAQWEQLDEATACFQRSIELQEQLARKAPAVVRHRSELATTLNNLGVAHCRSGRIAEADTAFGRARDLLTTLSADYPDEVAYRSSLAALLNNQALALAEAARHDDALAKYEAAIESQRYCHERWSDSPLMRELLSKMHYNYAKSLLAAGRVEGAIEVVLQRRDLWSGDGDRLMGVAAELAEIGGTLVAASAEGHGEKLQRQCDAAILATLEQALENGPAAKIDLANDERFAYLRGNEQFEGLVAQLSAGQRAARQ